MSAPLKSMLKPIGIGALLLIGMSLPIALMAQTKGVSRESVRNPLVIVEKDQDLGKRKIGELVEVEYRLENRGTTPMRITGCHVGCTCIVPDRLPMRIEPQQVKTFRVKFEMTNEKGKFRVPFKLYTSVKTQRAIDLSVTVEADPPSQPTAS